MASLGYFPLGYHIPLVIYPRTQWYVNTTIFLITLGRLEVGCVWGRGKWGGKKKKRLGSVCVGRGERERVGGVKEERLGSCVYVEGRESWGERREVLHMILFRGGGVQNILEKWGYLHGAWRSKLRVYYRGFGVCSPEKIFKNGATLPENFSTPLKFLNLS